MLNISREKEEINKVVEKETSVRVCDICGEEIGKYIRECSGFLGSYENRSFQSDEFAFEDDNVIIGKVCGTYNYGDSWGSSAEIFDICANCYEGKVKPLLEKELKIVPRKLEYDR